MTNSQCILDLYPEAFQTLGEKLRLNLQMNSFDIKVLWQAVTHGVTMDEWYNILSENQGCCRYPHNICDECPHNGGCDYYHTDSHVVPTISIPSEDFMYELLTEGESEDGFLPFPHTVDDEELPF